MQQSEGNIKMATPQMKYKVRAGTIDSGKKYEYKMAALLSLRCVIKEEDMWISSNADAVGAFDDIVLHQGNKTYMLQLKHKEAPKLLLERDFLAPKGDFSLQKYYQDITKVKESIDSKSKQSEMIGYLGSFCDIYFVLFTNRDVKKCEFLEHNTETFSFLNTTTSTTNVYKIDVTKLPNSGNTIHSSDIYLLFNQVHAKNIDQQIAEEIQKLAEHFQLQQQYNIKKIAEKFTKYVTDWAEGGLGGHYCLTKRDITCKLTELFFSKYKVNLAEERNAFYTSKTKHIWKNVIRDKVVTLVDFDEEVSKFLVRYVGSEVKQYCKKSPNSWMTGFSSEAQTLFYQDHDSLKADLLKIVSNRGLITLMDVYKCLWVANLLPLLLEITEDQQYHDLLNILRLSNYFYKILVINKSGEGKLSELVNNKEATIIKPFCTLQDLQEEARMTILEQPVTLQGRTSVKLKNLIDHTMFNYIKCSDVINILLKNFNIGGYFNPLPKYFITRSISKVFIRSEALKEVNGEVFLVEGNFGKYYQMQPEVCKFEDLNNNNLSGCRVILSGKSLSGDEIKKLEESLNKTIHQLTVYDSKYLEWKVSFGSVTNIRKYQVELDHVIESDVRNQLVSPVNIVSAVPGMGKSVLMDYVAQEAPTDKWVLKIDLKEHQDHYKSHTCKRLTTTPLEHLKYFKSVLFKQYNCATPLNKAVFRKLASTKDIIVLLDGFDEISVSYKQEVTNIAKSMLEEGFNVWVTTRPHMNSHLQEELNAFSVTLKPFSETDQKQCLTQYFRSKHGNSETLTDEFVEKLLRAAKKNLNDEDAKFTGIPLLTKLLADVFEDDCARFLSSGGTVTFNENFDLIYLYQTFINKQDEIFCSKFSAAAEDYLKNVFKEHQPLFALKLLFPSHNDLFGEINQMDNYYKDKPERIQLLQRGGVVAVDDKFNVNFIHRTFAEYLAAQWLSRNLQSNNEKTKRIVQVLFKERFTQEFKFLFNIFDRILAQDCPLHLAIINQQLELAREIICSDGDDVRRVDGGGRSVLHLIALYGTEFPLLFRNTAATAAHITNESEKFLRSKKFSLDEMLQIIEELPDDKLVNLKIDILGYTPLDYALANRSLAVAAQISKILKTSLINTRVPLKFKKDYLGYCAILEYNPLFNKLLLYFASKDLLDNKIDKKDLVETYFRLIFPTAISDNYSFYYYYSLISYYNLILSFLNKFDYLNATVLQLLQSGSGSDYSGWNGECYSDIRYAVCFGTQTNIAKLLSDGSKVNEIDLDHNTPLHYAVLHEKQKTVKTLLRLGAQINKQNIEKDTPLHLIIRKEVPDNSNFIYSKHKTINEIVVALVSEGADVNLKNAKGDTPLHLALLTKKLTCTKCCLVKYKHINAQNNEGRSVLHLAARNGWNEVINSIFSKSGVVNQQDNNDWTPLTYAVRNNNLQTVKLLISNGAEVNMRTKTNETVLHFAAELGLNDILIQLLSKCIDTNAQDNTGCTPLLAALVNNNKRAAELLISTGANLREDHKYSKTPMHRAAERGYNDILSEMLSRGFNIDRVDDCGRTPLFDAVYNNHVDTVEFLISKGCSVNVQDKTGSSVLHVAVNKNLKEILEMLLSRDADINSEDLEGWTPIFHAACNSNINMVKLLIDWDADVTKENKNSQTLLHIAAIGGCSDILNEVLLKGVFIDKPDNEGCTALFHAVSNNNIDAVKFLISKNASVNIQDDCGESILHVAAKKGYDEILNEILTKEVEIDKQDNAAWTPLFHAVFNNKLDAVKSLIAKGADVNIEDNYEEIPLHIAVEKGYSDILKELLTMVVNVDKKDLGGLTALFHAVYNNNLETVELLISKGANVSIENNFGETPFRIAIDNGYNDILKEMLSKDIEIDKQDRGGLTGLLHAMYNNNMEAVELLLSHDANVNVEDTYGETPLLIAVQKGYNDILNRILNKVEDINKQGRNGLTALSHAVISNNASVVNLLLSKGASVNLDNNFGETPIHLAVERSYNNILEELLLEGEVFIDKQDNSGFTILSRAVFNNNQEAVKLMLSKGSNVNIENNFGKAPLHLAVKNGKNAILKDLLEKDVDVDKQDNEGLTALFYAVYKNNEEAVKLLLSKGAAVNVEDKEGETLLHIAVKKGYNNLLNHLFSEDVDIDKKDQDGLTVLFYALYNNNEYATLLLLSKGASVKVENNYGETALHIAVEKEHVDTLREMLTKDVDVDKQDNSGFSALFHAVCNNSVDCVTLLTSKGASVNIQNSNGETPLHIAVKKGYTSVLEKLLMSDVDIDKQDNNSLTPLFVAVYNNNLEAVKLLISKGFSVNVEENYGETPLHVAVKKGYDDILNELLLQKVVDVDKQDDNARTPLFHAVSNNNVVAVKLLLSKGASVNTQQKLQETLLHVAARNNYYNILHQILSRDVDIDKQDRHGLTALFHAVLKNNPEVVNLLLFKGASVTVANNFGKIPLHFTVNEGYNSILLQLLTVEVDVDIPDHDGSTALFHAVYNNNVDAVKILIARGANINMEENYGETPLQMAVREGYNDILRILLSSKKIYIDKGDINGWTALFHAVYNNNLDAVKLLLFRGSSINLKTHNGDTLLHFAVKKGYNKILKELLRVKDVEVNKLNNKGSTALFIATYNNNETAVKLLLSKGASFSIEKSYAEISLHIVIKKHYNNLLKRILLTKDYDIDKRDNKGRSALFHAVLAYNLEAVKLLLSKGASVNLNNSEGDAPIHVAVDCGYNLILYEILKVKTVDIDLKDGNGLTALFRAVATNNLDAVNSLISKGARVNMEYNFSVTVLHVAVKLGYDTIVDALLSTAVDIDKQDDEGWTALFYAVRNNDFKMTGRLILMGASVKVQDKHGTTVTHLAVQLRHSYLLRVILPTEYDVEKTINIQDDIGWTPFFYAVHDNNLQAVQLLLSKNVNLNLVDKNNKTPLHFATRSDSYFILFELLLAGYDVNKQDISGWTPYFYAVHNNNLRALKPLILDCAKLDVADRDGRTLLHFAAESHCTDILKEILPKVSDVNQQDNFGWTALLYAICKNRIKSAKFLISNGANLHSKIESEKGEYENFLGVILSSVPDINQQNEDDGWTILFYAVQVNKVDMVKSLVSNGANIGTQDKDGKTAIHLAAQEGYNDILSVLLSVFLDTEKQDCYGQTPLFYAVGNNKTDTTKFLISKGANIFTQNNLGQTILHVAAANGYNDILAELLTQGQNVDVQDLHSWTPLFYAVRNNRLDTVKLLIIKGANSSSENNKGQVVLHIATKYKNRDILNEILSSEGVDINKRDNKGWSALFYSVYNNNIDTTRLLISKGASVNIKNAELKTPLHVVVTKGYKELLNEILQAKDFDINQQGSEGRTVLFHALDTNNVDVIKLLLNKGASVNTENIYAETPLHIAARKQVILKEILTDVVDVAIDKQDSDGWSALFHAVRNNNVSTVKTLIAKGASVNLQDKHGITVIHLAVQLRYSDILRVMLSTDGVEMNKQDCDGWTPLFYAVHDNNTETVKLLISNNSSINVEDKDNKTPLHLAAEKDYNDILLELLSKTDGIEIDKQDNKGCTILHRVVFNNNIVALNILLSKKASVNIKNNYSLTPLHVAIKRGYNDILNKILLVEGVNVDERDSNGWTLLYHTVFNKNMSAAKLLISLGASVDTQNNFGETILHFAVNLSPGILEEVLSEGVDIDKQDNEGCTALFHAVRGNKREAVEILIGKGANVNVKDQYGMTVTHYAVRQRYCTILSVILSSVGVDTNKQENTGCTPLLLAVADKNLQAVKLLVSKNSNADIEDDDNKIPLHFATHCGYHEILTEILSTSCNINKQDKSGWTPLFYAVHNNNVEAVKTLVSLNAKVDIADKDGKTLLHYSAEYGYSNILNEILPKLYDVDIQDKLGWTALFYALSENHLNSVKLLISKGSNLFIKTPSDFLKGFLDKVKDKDAQDEDGWTLLFYAVHNNKLDLVKFLISSGANVEVKDIRGKTAVHLAAYQRYNDILNLLLSVSDSSMEQRDCNDETPIFYAVRNNKVDSLKLLISKGANLNAQNRYGETVLHVAVQEEMNDTLGAILSAEVNALQIDKLDNNGCTPLLYAVRNNNLEAVKLLIFKGANVEVPNKERATTLHFAAEAGYHDILTVILSKTTGSIDVQDCAGNTPLFYAVRNNKEDIVKLLLSEGANENLKNNKGETISDFVRKQKIDDKREIIYEYFPMSDFEDEEEFYDKLSSPKQQNTFKDDDDDELYDLLPLPKQQSMYG